MLYTGYYALVWYMPDLKPARRKVYCDGKRWWVMNMSMERMMMLDDASGYVLLLEG